MGLSGSGRSWMGLDGSGHILVDLSRPRGSCWVSAGLVRSCRVLSGLGWSVNTFYDEKFVLCDLLFMINETQYIKH